MPLPMSVSAWHLKLQQRQQGKQGWGDTYRWSADMCQQLSLFILRRFNQNGWQFQIRPTKLRNQRPLLVRFIIHRTNKVCSKIPFRNFHIVKNLFKTLQSITNTVKLISLFFEHVWRFNKVCLLVLRDGGMRVSRDGHVRQGARRAGYWLLGSASTRAHLRRLVATFVAPRLPPPSFAR